MTRQRQEQERARFRDTLTFDVVEFPGGTRALMADCYGTRRWVGLDCPRYLTWLAAGNVAKPRKAPARQSKTEEI